ncbi:MAG: hypothetical protein U1A78_06725 [Polyangia bacterium]
MSATDCCQLPNATPQPANPPEPAGGEEAKAKARELKGKEAELKAKAAKEGKPVEGDSPLKPTSVAVPNIPKAAAKPGGQAPPAAKGKGDAKGGKVEAKKPAAGGDKKADAGDAKPGQKGGAAGAAQASIDAEVGAYLDSAPHDESKNAIHGQVKELVDASQNLQESAPPIESKGVGGKLMDIGKAVVPGLDAVGDKKNEGDFAKLAGKNENPYKDFNDKWGKTAQWLSRARDITGSLSSILGKIGLILTIAGVIISLTGIGAALGGPIATIGRVISIITLALDAAGLIMNSLLVVIGAIMLKNPNLSPEQRAKIAGNLISDANSTFASLMSVAMAVPGVGKLAAAAGKGIKGLATGLISKIASKIGAKGAIAAIKNIGAKLVSKIGEGIKKILPRGGGGPGIFQKLADKMPEGLKKFGTQVKELPGKIWQKGGEALEWAKDKGLKAGEWIGDKAGKAKDFIGDKAGKATDWVKGKAGDFKDWIASKFPRSSGPGIMDRIKGSRAYQAVSDKAGKAWDFTKDKATRGYNFVDQKTQDWEKWFNKATGGEWVEKNISNRIDYYTQKWSGQAAGHIRPGDVTHPHLDGNDVATGGPKGPQFRQAEADQMRTSLTQDINAARRQRIDIDRQIRELEASGADAARLAELQAARPGIVAKETAANQALSDANANFRARQRIDNADGVSDRMPNRGSEWADAANYRDRSRTRFNPATGQEELTATATLGDTWGGVSRGLENKQASDDLQNEQKREGANIRARDRAAGTEQFVDQYRAEHPGAGGPPGPDGPQPTPGPQGAQPGPHDEHEGDEHDEHEGGEHDEAGGDGGGDGAGDGAGGAAPQLPGLDTGAQQGELAGKVQGMLGDLGADEQDEEHKDEHKDDKDEHKDDQDEEPGQQSTQDPQKPTDSPAPDKQAAKLPAPESKPAGGEQPQAQPDGGAGGAGGAGADGAKGKADAGAVGAVPYWPKLLKDYEKDLQDLDKAEKALGEYKTKQLDGYKKAVGIQDDAKKKQDEAKGREPQQKDEQKKAQEEQQELTRSGGQAGKAGGEAGKAAAKKGEASGGAGQGASAASADVPDPPAPHWWDHIINLAKKFLVNYLAKGLAFIQNIFTNAILKVVTGMDLEALNRCANCTQQKTGEGAQTAAQAGQKNQQSQAKDQETAAKAQQTMTEAQQLQAKTKENIQSADDLIGAIGQIRSLIKQEIQAGNDYIKQVVQAKAEAQREKEAREQAEQKKQEEAEAKRKADEEKAKKAAQERAQAQSTNKDKQEHGPAKDKSKDKEKEAKKDEPNPAKLAKLRAAAQLVSSTASSYNAKVLQGVQAARGALKGGGGLRPELAEQAVHVFDGAVGEFVNKHQRQQDDRAGKLQSLGGRTIGKTELKDVGQQISHEAAEADQDLVGALGAIKSVFEGCYSHSMTLKKQSDKKRKHKREALLD